MEEYIEFPVIYLYPEAIVHRHHLVVPVVVRGGFGYAVFNPDDGNVSATHNCLSTTHSAIECGKLWLDYQLDVEAATC